MDKVSCKFCSGTGKVLLGRGGVTPCFVWAANDLNATVRMIKSNDGINKHELKIEMTQTKNSQDQA